MEDKNNAHVNPRELTPFNVAHDTYAARFGEGEWLVTTSSGMSARYDSGVPGSYMVEAKTGYGFMNNKSLYYHSWVSLALNAQFAAQSWVATNCGFAYYVAVDNASGFQGIKDSVWPVWPIRYIP